MAAGLDIQHLVYRIVLSHHNLLVSVRSGTLRRKVQATGKRWGEGMGQIFCIYLVPELRNLVCNHALGCTEIHLDYSLSGMVGTTGITPLNRFGLLFV